MLGLELLRCAARARRAHSSRWRSSALVASAEPPLEPLRAGVADLREPLGEHRLGLAREHLDRAVELARRAAAPRPRARDLIGAANCCAASSA